MNGTSRRSPVEIIGAAETTVLARAGVSSQQVVWPGNLPEAQVTVTRVTVAPGAEQPRHAHANANAEQVWIVEQGRAELLLADDSSRPLGAGCVVRTPAGETHGLRNTGSEPFIYLAITTPPVDFRPAYDGAL
jgi:quercetin dioxygenase-like cupin family protein